MALVIHSLIDRYLHKCRQRTEAQITRIVLHHDAGVAPQVVEKVIPRFDAYALQHDDSGGYPYTYSIDPWGKVYKCRKTTSVTAHCKNNNTPSLAVMLMGYFHHDNHFAGQRPTERQLKSLDELIPILKAAIPTIKNFTPHKKVPGSKTACPGNMFDYGRVDALCQRLGLGQN